MVEAAAQGNLDIYMQADHALDVVIQPQSQSERSPPCNACCR